MSDRRKNIQMNQPGVAPMPEGNGWPVPLTDPSNPLRVGTTNGKSGSTESRAVETVKRENIGGVQ